MNDEYRSEAAELRIAIFRLARRMRAHHADESLSHNQYTVLGRLNRTGQGTLTELAEYERVTAPSMNRTVNSLEEAGYVTRSTDEHDRRKVNIILTPEGRDTIEETIRRRDAWLQQLLAELPEQDRNALIAASRILLEAVEQ